MSGEKFVIKPPSSIFPISEGSFGEIIYQNLLSHTKEVPLLIDGHTGESLSSSKLLQKTCSLAEALRNFGCSPGTVVAITSPNNLEFFVPIIALYYIGAITLTVNHTYTNVELNHILNISKPRIIFCSEELVPKYKKLSEKLNFIDKIIIIDSEESRLGVESMQCFIKKHTISPTSRILTTPVNSKDCVATLLCSSGTTGLPKCVMLTHKNINVIYNHFRDPRIYEQNSTTLFVLPFFHGYGFFVTLTGIATNSTIVFLRNFSPDHFLKTIQEYKATRLFLPYANLAIRDLKTGEFLGPNKPGELCIKGDSVMKGYYGNPEATINTFTKDNWLLSGDVGYYDEEQNFFITDRIKELIKYKAYQVAPAELEAVLLTHPDIMDCAVIGIPDEKAGELPLAFVVKTKESNVREKDIQEFVQNQLSPQKWLRGGVIFVKAIPKTANGKIERKELKVLSKKLKSKL